MTCVLISLNPNVQHYSGLGYQYFFRKNWVNGNAAKLQISRALLDRFVARKGRVNTVGLQHLEVLSQGAGWYLIASDKPENDGVVVQFLAALNRWVLKQQQADTAPVTQRSHYFVQAPLHEHTSPVERHQVIKTRPLAEEGDASPALPVYRLRELASSVNARYGH